MEFKDWLNERYQVDADARNHELEKMVLDRLQGNAKLRIVDLGAGTGSNFRYYHTRLRSRYQNWTLIDQDQSLLSEARRNITEIYSEGQIDESEGVLKIQNEENTIDIHFQQANIFESDLSEFLQGVDLIVSNALFDLASDDQFESFCNRLPLKTAIFLSTLNYQSTDFAPSISDDINYVNQYHLHMSRQQHFGRSMGAECVERMSEILSGVANEFHSAPSVWELDHVHQTLQQGLIEFMQAAMSDMGLADEQFEEWMNARLELISKGSSNIKVHHTDLLTLPPK